MTMEIGLSGSPLDHLQPAGLGYALDVFARRMVLECLQESTASWWERRAAAFDRVGNERCDEIADACRNKASFLRMYGVEGLEEDLTAAVADAQPTQHQHRRAA
jgi:hypothetical protein